MLLLLQQQVLSGSGLQFRWPWLVTVVVCPSLLGEASYLFCSMANRWHTGRVTSAGSASLSTLQAVDRTAEMMYTIYSTYHAKQEDSVTHDV
jgi:hypothetical protein